MIKKYLIPTLLAFASVYTLADTGFKDLIRVTESDNSPACMAGQIKFANGNVTCSGNVATVADQNTGGGGGGSSSLQVTRSGVEITSPTASINFYSGDFLGGAIGTTAQIALNPATTNYIHNQSTLQSGSTFYVSSGTVNGPLRVTGLLNVGTDATGFSEHSRLSFDPDSNNPQLNIYANRNTASGSDINWIDSGGSTYANLSVVPSAGAGIAVPKSGGFSVTYGAIFGSATVSNLASGQCVQTGTGGLLTVTGSACGSGSGGGDSLGSHIATMTITANYGIAGSTAVFAPTTTSRATKIVPFGDLAATVGATADATSGGATFDVSSSSSFGVLVFNNAAQTVATGNSMLTLISTNTAYGGYFLRIMRNDGNSNGDIRIDSPAPNIEMIETDQATPDGKFEVGINNKLAYVAFRNAADDSFERLVNWQSIKDGGYMSLLSTAALRFEDLEGSAIGFKSGDLSATWTHTLWTTPNNTGKLLKQTANGGDRPLAWDDTVGVAASSITFSSSVAVGVDLRVAGTASVVGTGGLSVSYGITGSTFAFSNNGAMNSIVSSSTYIQASVKSSSTFIVKDVNGNPLMYVDNSPPSSTSSQWNVIASTSNGYEILTSTSGAAPYHLSVSTAGIVGFSGPGAPPDSQALCLLSGKLGHCTSVVGVGGGCTCVSP